VTERGFRDAVFARFDEACEERHQMHVELREHVVRDEERFASIQSDIRGLKGDVNAVEGSAKLLALDAARADVLVAQGTQDWTEQRQSKRDWLRQAAIGLLLVAVGAAITFLTTR